MSIDTIAICGLGFHLNKKDLKLFKVDESSYEDFIHDDIEINVYGNSFIGNIRYCILIKNLFKYGYDLYDRITDFMYALKIYDKENVFKISDLKEIKEVLIL